MDSKLRTSFIPKKTLGEPRKATSGVGFVPFIATAVLVLSLLGWGGAYAYVKMLESNVTDLRGQVDRARDSFNTRLLNELEDKDARIKSASRLIEEHVSLAYLLGELDRITLKTVRYRSIEFRDDGKDTLINLTGEAADFSSVALQAKAFSEDGRFINPIFSGMDSSDNGAVTFKAKFNAGSDLIQYVAPSQDIGNIPSTDDVIFNPELTR